MLGPSYDARSGQEQAMATRKASGFRIEHDSMGEPCACPRSALWGAQTQRAIDNFAISGPPHAARLHPRAGRWSRPPPPMVNGTWACSMRAQADAIARPPRPSPAARTTRSSRSTFPDRLRHLQQHERQRGHRRAATRTAGPAVHPNDHVNLGQSSNDVIPTAIHVGGALARRSCCRRCATSTDDRPRARIRRRRQDRPHAPDGRDAADAGAGIRRWAAQLDSAHRAHRDSLKRVRRLPIGGTAIGTGINADPAVRHPGLAKRTVGATGARSNQARNLFEAPRRQDECVELSGQLNALAVALMKIANDLRWMNSGPLAGLGEIELAGAAAGLIDHAGQGQSGDPGSVCMVAPR
jgi:fumarate hydratase class II